METNPWPPCSRIRKLVATQRRRRQLRTIKHHRNIPDWIREGVGRSTRIIWISLTKTDVCIKVKPCQNGQVWNESVSEKKRKILCGKSPRIEEETMAKMVKEFQSKTLQSCICIWICISKIPHWYVDFDLSLQPLTSIRSLLAFLGSQQKGSQPVHNH